MNINPGKDMKKYMTSGTLVKKFSLGFCIQFDYLLLYSYL